MSNHSRYNKVATDKQYAGIYILPFTTDVKGPAPRFNPEDFMTQTQRTKKEEAPPDIIDEAILFYRANVFLKEYEVKGPADRFLIYLTLYITELLKEFATQSSLQAAEGVAYQLAIKKWALPGTTGFPLAAFYPAIERREEEYLESYLLQARQEIGKRLAKRVFRKGRGDKWWLLFASYDFLGKSLTKN